MVFGPPRTEVQWVYGAPGPGIEYQQHHLLSSLYDNTTTYLPNLTQKRSIWYTSRYLSSCALRSLFRDDDDLMPEALEMLLSC